MKRLLTIKEAAEFLNVSEMSLRRWTNKGLLKCYRVGGKKERRFDVSDLRDFLDDSTNNPAISIGSNSLKISKGAHVTQFFSGKNEGLDFSVSYALTGLISGEAVLAVMPPEKVKDFISALGLRHPPLDNDLKVERLVISEGKDTPEDMVGYLSRFAARTQKFRVLGDMSWALEKGWDLAALSALEQAPILTHPVRNGVLVCQYDLEKFSGAHIMMAAESHEQIIYKGGLEKSPYYRLLKECKTPAKSQTRH